MKYQYFIILIWVLFTFNIYGNDLALEYVDIAGIQFKVIKNGESNRRFIWIHGDEKTAAMLLKRHLKDNYGTAFLIENNKREVYINGYMMDPNRIFSNVGAEKNLIKLNDKISKTAVDKTVDLIANDKEMFFEKGILRRVKAGYTGSDISFSSIFTSCSSNFKMFLNVFYRIFIHLFIQCVS